MTVTFVDSMIYVLIQKDASKTNLRGFIKKTNHLQDFCQYLAKMFLAYRSLRVSATRPLSTLVESYQSRCFDGVST